MLLVAAGLVLLGGAGLQGWSIARVRTVGLPSAALLVAGFVSAAVLGPALLPWLPGRAFAVKGAVLGAATVAIFAALGWTPDPSWLQVAAWGLGIPALASFAVMNFTGATTFTSQSGVLREMRIALPLQLGAAVLAGGLWLVGLFVGGAA